MKFDSSQMARKASLILRCERALVRQEEVLGELLGQRRAALDDAVGAGVLHDRAERAEHVDAEMLIEAAVLDGHRRLLHIVRDLLQRDGVGLHDAALADLGARAVDEGDGEVDPLVPVLPGRLEGGLGEGQHAHGADDAPGEAFGGQLLRGPAAAADAHVLRQADETGPSVADRGAEGVHAGVDHGVERQQRSLDARKPLFGKRIEHPPLLNSRNLALALS